MLLMIKATIHKEYRHHKPLDTYQQTKVHKISEEM